MVRTLFTFVLLFLVSSAQAQPPLVGYNDDGIYIDSGSVGDMTINHWYVNDPVTQSPTTGTWIEFNIPPASMPPRDNTWPRVEVSQWRTVGINLPPLPPQEEDRWEPIYGSNGVNGQTHTGSGTFDPSQTFPDNDPSNVNTDPEYYYFRIEIDCAGPLSNGPGNHTYQYAYLKVHEDDLPYEFGEAYDSGNGTEGDGGDIID